MMPSITLSELWDRLRFVQKKQYC